MVSVIVHLHCQKLILTIINVTIYKFLFQISFRISLQNRLFLLLGGHFSLLFQTVVEISAYKNNVTELNNWGFNAVTIIEIVLIMGVQLSVSSIFFFFQFFYRPSSALFSWSSILCRGAPQRPIFVFLIHGCSRV